MAKAKTQFVCGGCGATAARYLGKCPQCGAWDAMAEEALPPPVADRAGRGALGDGRVQVLAEVEATEADRLPTGETEFDRALGGGFVPGSACLLGGDPGIGKSTLLLQAALHIAARSDRPVLYVSAEESARQIRLRAERLGALPSGLLVLAENNLNAILRAAESACPALLVVDSIQMVYWPEMGSAPGSIGQVRECAAGLIALAKRTGVPLALVGHVTKDGAIAGPKVLEHMVDVVLAFEGDRHHAARLLRGVKNRYGATGEVGVFEMSGAGLRPVPDPSRLFLSRRETPAPGSVPTASMEGTRPFLVEVQALVAPGYPGNAKRRFSGADSGRVSILVAVLEKRCGYELYDKDIFVNVVGGGQLDEPAADLAIALAIASSLLDRPAARGAVAWGEVGLGGEVRPVPASEARLREAGRLGFSCALLPAENAAKAGAASPVALLPVRELAEAVRALESAPARPADR